MNKAQLTASLALWKSREVKWYREWQRLKKKNTSTLPGKARDLAFQEYNVAHKMRVKRTIQLRNLEAKIEHISDAGAARLIDREGIIPYAYTDSQGWATAWVGHLIMPRHKGITAADNEKWGSKKSPAPRTRIIKFFREVDLLPYEKVVQDANAKRVKNGHPSITPNQFDACVSLAFNIGTGGFSTSSVAKRIAAGAGATSVAEAFMFWNKPPEIIGRRQGEANQYKAG